MEKPDPRLAKAGSIDVCPVEEPHARRETTEDTRRMDTASANTIPVAYESCVFF